VPGPPAEINTWRRREARRRQIRRAALLLLVLAAGVAVVEADGSSAVRSHRHLALISPNLRARLPTAHLSARESKLMSRARATITRLTGLGLPIYCAGPRGREIALTFDDGPGPYTRVALRKLRQSHEQATFFVVGRNVPLYRGLLRRELAAGALGDHTYTHPVLTTLGPPAIRSELARTAHLIEAQTRERVDLFRPPYELHNVTVDQIARRLGLLEILWNVDSADSLGANWSQIIKNVATSLRPGAIVLMHENRGQTIRALSIVLPMLHRRRLRSVSVPALLASDPPSKAQVRHGRAACGVSSRAVRSGG
jgi:peptidoglycan/xylan/chitin deacetylase (PgdA/CDA1 family)